MAKTSSKGINLEW